MKPRVLIVGVTRNHVPMMIAASRLQDLGYEVETCEFSGILSCLRVAQPDLVQVCTTTNWQSDLEEVEMILGATKAQVIVETPLPKNETLGGAQPFLRLEERGVRVIEQPYSREILARAIQAARQATRGEH